MQHMRRRESVIDEAKQRDRIDRARRMTPQQRLQACLDFSAIVLEFHSAGKRHRRNSLAGAR